MLSMPGWCFAGCGRSPCGWKRTTATDRPSRTGCSAARRSRGCLIPALTRILRVDAHSLNGQPVATWLLRRPEVARVHYPGLDSHPQRELFCRQMGHGGALLSFELVGGEAAACRFLDRLQLILHAVSLGGMESLATRPAMSSHRGMTSEARQRAGVSDSLIRLSVGVEALEDLLADLEQALAG